MEREKERFVISDSDLRKLEQLIEDCVPDEDMRKSEALTILTSLDFYERWSISRNY